MSFVIFYSWQSDLPNRTNRSFIQTALKAAVKGLMRDDEIKVEPRIDEATAGVPGAPDISQTIFQKIEQCQLFICDVTFVNDGEPVIDSNPSNPDDIEDPDDIEGDSTGGSITKKRITPNPNVMIEAGYALRSLGFQRVIFVFNTAYGPVEALPFDIRPRRILTYEAKPDTPNLKTIREGLQKDLDAAIRSVISHHEALIVSPQEVSKFEQAIKAVSDRSGHQQDAIDAYMVDLGTRLEQIAPKWPISGRLPAPDLKTLIESINESEPIVQEFTDLARTTASHASTEAAKSLYAGFSQFLIHYHKHESGSVNYADFDFYKFLGHELFVTLFAALIKRKQWSIVKDLLEDQIYVPLWRNLQPETVHFSKISDYIRLFHAETKKPENRQISPHADFLKGRHATGTTLIPLEEFMEADYFLFLRSITEVEEASRTNVWRGSSTLYLGERTPRFLMEISKASKALEVATALGCDDVETMKSRIQERGYLISRQYSEAYDLNPLYSVNFDLIGNQP